MNTIEAKKVLETAPLCFHEPLSFNDLKKLYAEMAKIEVMMTANSMHIRSGRFRKNYVTICRIKGLKWLPCRQAGIFRAVLR